MFHYVKTTAKYFVLQVSLSVICVELCDQPLYIMCDVAAFFLGLVQIIAKIWAKL